MRQKLLTAIALVGVATSMVSAQGDTPKLPIGMNTTWVNYSCPFIDVMKQARYWDLQNTDNSRHSDSEDSLKKTFDFIRKGLPLDSNGYPLEVPFTLAGFEKPQKVFTYLDGRNKPGRYVLLWDGAGQVGIGLNCTKVSEEPNRIVVDINFDGNVTKVAINSSSRDDHVRNIRIVPIDKENTDYVTNPFRQEYLDMMRPFHCIRFMDWMSINGGTNQLHWSDRVTPGYYTQVHASIESCIRLCNVLQTNMWINVPHPAWDDWIENAARLVADSLDRDLKVYVEYSNEIWNWAGAYPQSQWVLRNGRWTHAPEWDCADSIYEALSAINPEPRDHPEKDAYMVNRTLRIWRSVFEEKGQRGRLVRVAAYQGGYSSIFRRLVNWLFTNGDGCDVVAPDAYFGIKHTVAHFDSVDTLPGQAVTTQQILDSASAAISRAYQENDSSIASLAEEYSLGIVTYEAGDHMFDYKSHTWDAALQAASSDSGIYDVYMDNFRHWGEAMNSELCVLYSSKRTFYHFGHVEDYSQIYLPREQMLRQAPKYLAALEANVERTPVARRSRGRTSIQGLSPRIRVTSGVVRIFPAVAGRLDVRLLDLAGRTLTHVRYDVAEKQDAVAVRVPRRLAGRAYVVEVKHAGTGTTRLLTVAP